MTPKLSFRWVPSGDAGARDTLQWMRSLALGAQRDPLLGGVAQSILRSAPVGDVTGQARQLRDWMTQHFAFVNDPDGFELLREPYVMLRDIQREYVALGDCDDAAILSAAIAKKMGLKPRFRALAFRELTSPYTHVITDIWTPLGWMDVDVTRSAQMIPPVISRQMTTMEI